MHGRRTAIQEKPVPTAWLRFTSIALSCGVIPTSTDLLRLRGGGDLHDYIGTLSLASSCWNSDLNITSSHIAPQFDLSVPTLRSATLIKMAGTLPLPEKFDDLPDRRRYWPAPAGSEEEGLGMLRLLTPEVVAEAARTQIQTGERVCLNWDIENLSPPGKPRRGRLNARHAHVFCRIRPQTI